MSEGRNLKVSFIEKRCTDSRERISVGEEGSHIIMKYCTHHSKGVVK